MVIQKLNQALIEKIRGSFTINTLTQCASELILNSLDANSTAIAVRLNLITLKVQVIDNGDGISKDSMDCVGLRFYTSKCLESKDLERNLKTHGYRGQALANISECSKSVSVTSRRRNSSHTYSKIIGKGFGRDVGLARERSSAGTTVTVEGFFYCFPVRKRRIVAEVVLGDIKRYLESLLLVHPKVSFTLKNDVTNELILDSPKQDSVISMFRHLHPDMLDVDLSLLKVTRGTTAVEGMLCKELYKYKNLQYLYVNKRPVHSTKTLKFVSGLFLSRNKKQQRENKHPIFLVNIKCPYAEVDMMLNSTETTVHFKHTNLVMRCLEKLIATLFGEKTRKPEEKTPEARPPSECSISKIRGAVKVNGFKRGAEQIPSPTPEEEINDYDRDESLPLAQQIGSENPNDEKSGKGLIMDMFLKSTRVFRSEESVETVFEEEANLCFEKSVTDMKKTTSVCMNLKSRRKLKKKHVKLQSTAVQTSFHVKTPKIPDGDFTIVFNDDKVDFVPKDPDQEQPVTTTEPHHYRKPDKDNFNLFALLPASSPPRPPHPYPAHDMRYEHFQPSYPTHYYSGCNGNCCMQPAVPYCASNFYNPGCERENCHNNVARGFMAPNMDCEYEKSHYFKPPRDEPVRFPNHRDLGCRHESNHGLTRNFAAPQPGPSKFLSYRNPDCGYENDWLNPAKNPQSTSPRHHHRDLAGYKYYNNEHNFDHIRHQGNHVTQNNIPHQPNPFNRNNHHYNYINLDTNQPTFSNYPEFGRNHGNNMEDLPETDKTPTRNKESSKPFKHLKLDFLCPPKQRENVPDSCFSFQSAQMDQQVNNKFHTNLQNPTRENHRHVSEFNPNLINADKDEDNFTEFTAKFLEKHHEDAAEYHANLSNQNPTEFNPDFMNADKDEDNFTEFTAKFLSTHKAQKEVAGFASNDISELFQGNKRNPFEIARQTDNQERCTLNFHDVEDKGVGRSEESKLPKDWVRKRKRKGVKFLGQYEN